MLGIPVPAENCRKPEIMADAAHAILTRDSRAVTGNFYIDDEVLAAAGVTDLGRYAVAPGQPLLPDLFLEAAGQ
jgi:citronellol/citronellal dehydrogenase